MPGQDRLAIRAALLRRRHVLHAVCHRSARLGIPRPALRGNAGLFRLDAAVLGPPAGYRWAPPSPLANCIFVEPRDDAVHALLRHPDPAAPRHGRDGKVDPPQASGLAYYSVLRAGSRPFLLVESGAHRRHQETPGTLWVRGEVPNAVRLLRQPRIQPAVGRNPFASLCGGRARCDARGVGPTAVDLSSAQADAGGMLRVPPAPVLRLPGRRAGDRLVPR